MRNPIDPSHGLLGELLLVVARDLTMQGEQALVELARMRGFGLLGAIACAGVIAWTAWLSYLGPPSGCASTAPTCPPMPEAPLYNRFSIIAAPPTPVAWDIVFAPK